MGAIFGQLTKGSSGSLAVNIKYVARVFNPADGWVAKLSVWMDGFSTSLGTQPQLLRGIVYDSTGALRASGTEVVVPAGTVAQWVDLPFAQPVFLDMADYDIGIHVGGLESTARAYFLSPSGAGGKDTFDTYSDGPGATFGASTARTYQMAVFATMVSEWSPPEDVDDFYLGRLPWPESQRLFGEGSPATKAIQQANVGWHGDSLDAETGAFCLVQEGSRWEQLIGERVRLVRTDTGATVFVYVHNRWAVEDDLSVPRRAFMALGAAAADSVRCSVAVME